MYDNKTIKISKSTCKVSQIRFTEDSLKRERELELVSQATSFLEFFQKNFLL